MGMEMGLHLGQRQEQRLVLTPVMLQKVEILQLTTMELESRIQQELDENPTLETTTEDEPDKPEETALKTDAEREVEEELSRLDRIQSEEWNEDFGGGSKRFEGEKDKKLEALENTAARGNSLQDSLFGQIKLMENVSELVVEICNEIIYNIDNNGYLLFSYEDLCDALPFPISHDEYEEAVTLVQALDPKGVGARSLAECLILQLDPAEPRYKFLRELIEHHLEDIKRNKLPQIARRTGKSLAEIKSALVVLGKLNPRPGALFALEETQFVIPDVIVEHIDGEYIVRVENQYVPQLRVSGQYRKMLETQGNDASVRAFIKKKIDSAQLLIESIEQRMVTLYKVASEIVKRQSTFLDKGIKHLRPLKMQEVADVVGVHVSTVSRAINKKFMQTPRGIYSMKFFFTGGLSTTEGDESQEAVKQRVKEVLEGEDKANPLSDDEIMQILKKDGVDIARRTVSKYRKALGIASSRERREF